MNPALIEQINRRVAERRSDFERAIQEENTHHEGALESLCAEIYTDMTQVEKGEEQIDGLVSGLSRPSSTCNWCVNPRRADELTCSDHFYPLQACKLLPHQVTGIAWLVSRETGKKKGGILADDMGLGKVRPWMNLPVPSVLAW